jgi:DNA-binding NarL/FixJ family response regulator
MIKSELERVHAHFNQEIGDTSTSAQNRKRNREIVFMLIELENLIVNESEIGLKSAIAAVNGKILDPKFRINHNIKRSEKDAKKEFKLTKKELEVLALLPKGLSIKNMALQLYLTEATIKSHMYSIYRKLEVSNRIQAIAKASENNLLNLK